MHTSNITISNYRCFIKAYGRKNTTFNLYATIKRPLFKMFFNYDLTYKHLSQSQRSIINITEEFCKVLNGSLANPFFKFLMDKVPEIGAYFHTCPYKGNFSFVMGFADLPNFPLFGFPGGFYIATVKLFDKIDKNILTVVAEAELVSRDKSPI